MKVVKKDGKTAWPLAGATFELKSIRLDNGGSYQQSLTTDETGSVLFEDIPNGTYELRETKAPLGYEKGDWVETIVVTSKSDIVMYREYTNEPMSGIVIKKIDAITGKAVPGVKFVITPMLPLTGPALERTTDEYGLIELEGLAMGTYEIKEISAPDPYIVDALIADRCLLKMISCDDINRNSKEVGKAEEKDALNEILKNSIIKTCESAKLCKDFGISLWEKYLSAATGSPLMLQDASGAIKDLILSGMTYADDSLSFDELEAMTPKKFVELVIETAIESFNDAISTWRNEKTQ